MIPRLVTIPSSHYCEKARWALDRAKIAYREEGHAPIFSRLATWRAGHPGSVPVLVTDEGVFGDSTDILGWVDRRLPLYEGDAAVLEERLDEALGPAARNLSYTHLTTDRRMARRVGLGGAPRWERALGGAFFGPALGLMKRFYKISADTPARALADLRAIFAELGPRLADGRRYLCGDRLTAADITLAALSAPALLPEGNRSGLPRLEDVSATMRAIVDELRATPAGKLALRLYAEDRSPV